VRMRAGACTVIIIIGSVSAVMITTYAGADCASTAAVAACGRHTRVWQAHPPVHGPIGSLEMSPPPGRSVREGSSAGAWIRKREDARAAGVRASCVSVSVEQRCDTRPVAEAAMGLAPCLLRRLLSAGSLARAAPPNSCAHSDSLVARSRLVAFECWPQCRMYGNHLLRFRRLAEGYTEAHSGRLLLLPTASSGWMGRFPPHNPGASSQADGITNG
jgi:hypothetical protein